MAIDKLFFVDTETTGLDPETDQVIEIAAAVGVFNDYRRIQVVNTYHALIVPLVPMSEFSAKNFAGVDWSEAIPASYAISGLFSFWRAYNSAAWIGQNPIFDFSFLKPLAKSYSIAWPKYPEVDYHVFDVASMALPLVINGEIESVSLRNTRKWAGCPGENQEHRAMGDVRDMISVFNALRAWSCGEAYYYQDPLQMDLL